MNIREWKCGTLGVLALICCLVCVPAAHSSSETIFLTNDIAWLRIARGAKISVRTRSNVSDNCWSKPDTSKTAIELEMIRSGVVVEETALNEISISAIGYRLKDGQCIAHLTFDLSIFDPDLLTSGDASATMIFNTFNRSLFQRTLLMSGESDISQKTVVEATNYSRDLLVEAEKSKNSIRDEVLKLDPKSSQYLMGILFP